MDSPPRTHDLIRHPRQGETSLYLVRHGQTVANVERRLVGVTDVPLDHLGTAQAQRAGERLRDLSLDAILTSPLKRAHATAEAIAAHHPVRPTPIAGLAEVNFGLAEGLTLEEFAARHTDFAERLRDLDDHTLGWPGGETRAEFHARVLATFLEILADYERHTIAVVAHGGVIASFVAQIENGQPNDFRRYLFANCSVTHLVVDAARATIHAWNDVGHLDEINIMPFSVVPSDDESPEYRPSASATALERS